MKAGRPELGDRRPRLRHVGFKADDETLLAIRRLTEALSAEHGGVVAAKSVAIRRALIEAAARLR